MLPLQRAFKSERFRAVLNERAKALCARLELFSAPVCNGTIDLFTDVRMPMKTPMKTRGGCWGGCMDEDALMKTCEGRARTRPLTRPSPLPSRGTLPTAFARALPSCAPRAGLNAAQVFIEVVAHSRLEPLEVCGDAGICTVEDTPAWNVTFPRPKPPVRATPVPSPSSRRAFVLHLTDVHYVRGATGEGRARLGPG